MGLFNIGTWYLILLSYTKIENKSQHSYKGILKYKVIFISTQICNMRFYSRVNVEYKETETSEPEDEEYESGRDKDVGTEDSESDESVSS